MYKPFGTLLFISVLMVFASSVWSEDQAKKPEAAPPKVEEPKKDDVNKDDVKQPEKKKESVEKRLARCQKRVDEGVLKEDWDKVLAALDEIIDDKEINADDQMMAMIKKFLVLAEEKFDGAKACPLAKKLSELGKDDPEVLNELAWTILDTEGLKNRDLDLALEIAKKAVEAAHGQSAEILDTLARAYFEKCDLDKAVEWQTKAVEKSKTDNELTDEVKEEINATLEKYKAKQAEKKSEKKEEPPAKKN